MRINHNIAALNTYRQLSNNTINGSKSLEKLSSGLRINRAGDDAAGLSISEKMRAQIRGLDQASRNAQDGISLIQTAEGALSETQSILQRMRELAVQAASDTLEKTDRQKIQSEVDQLATEITRISNTTEFNTQNLLNGGLSSSTANGKDITFHIGANSDQELTFGIKAMDAFTLGVAGSSTESVLASGAVDVTDVSVTGTAAAVIDGNQITVSAVKVGGAAAKEAAITGGSAAATTDLTSISADAKLTITIDGTDYSLDQTALQGATGTGKTITDLIGAINTAIGVNGTASEGTDADAGKIVIKSATTGTSSSVAISITGATTTDIDTAFGLSNQSATGTAATSDTYTVTLTDNQSTPNSVDITGLTGSEATITGTGGFAGFTLTTDGAFDENVAATINLSVTQGSAASIAADGTVTKAVANAGISVSTRSDANGAIKTINDAINNVSEERSKLGSLQNRLEHTINNLDTSSENLVAAESRIRDVDMAKEMMEFTKNSILQQAATAMLAQANQAPQSVLQLLS